MAENHEIPREIKLTPMMRQYLEVKEQYPDCIIFFRLGDFYEMFAEDAVLASEILEITLTSRDKGPDAVPMCGFPHHSSRDYVQKLIDRGYKVAICEQTEDPSKTKKLVKREVVEVITPGLVTDMDMLEPRAPHYLMGIAQLEKLWGFAYLDATTGEFRLGQAKTLDRLAEEVGRIAPREVVVARDFDGEALARVIPKDLPVNRADLDPDVAKAQKKILANYARNDLFGLELDNLDAGLVAGALTLDYLGHHNKNALKALLLPARHMADDFMFLGRTTERNLEIFLTMSGERKGSLFSVMDKTRTAMGGRELRRRIAYPLMDVAKIQKRLDSLSELFARGELRRLVREALRSVADLERLGGKVAMGTANPRDMAALRGSLGAVGELKALVADVESLGLKEIHSALDPIQELCAYLGQSLSDSPPAVIADGGVIREGFNAEIDELRQIQKGGRGFIAKMQADERERTGISTLKIGYNKVFGYFIEISRAKAEKVPANYERRQTLANAERYVTPELKDMEAKILSAEDKCLALEIALFGAIKEEAGRYLARIRSTAFAVSALDVVSALAELAVERRYVKPQVDDGAEMRVVGGRHPVVEALETKERFVPNDLTFDVKRNRLLVITGPNMSGKSTILRQTAIIAIMAQLGSFVPAESASIGVFDRIFTRVGASDDLARGRSTFMVEMMEAATILLNATRRSLVILDEIGRGTSTFDGLSIAWAVAEYIHDLGSRTLFATHYHELTDLSETMKGVANYNVAVKRWQGKIIFLRRLVEGGVNRSYGIEVAELAGLPDKVIGRAREVLKNLESVEMDEMGLPRIALSASLKSQVPHKQLSLFSNPDSAKRDKLVEELANIPIEDTSPLGALVLLNELKGKASLIKRGES